MVFSFFFVVVVGYDGGVVEGSYREPLVSPSERISRVDVTVAGDAERGGVGFARYVRRCLLADLAHPNTSVAGSELVNGMNFGVARDAKESRVGSAEEICCCGFA